MTAAMFDMVRDVDVTGISGTGSVGTVVEFDNGDTVLHWDSATPSTNVYRDRRHIEALHGHGGATRLVPHETNLEKAYGLVVPYLLTIQEQVCPLKVAPHPDHPDRLRLVFRDEPGWRWWVALLDGSSHAASHVEVDGETRHTWITPDGNVWLIYHTPLTGEATQATGVIPQDWEDQLAGERYPLETYDREDR